MAAHARWTAAALVPMLLSCPAGAAETVDDRLSRMDLRLTETEPYLFVLGYHGPTMPFRGQLCYHFAGYNETCLDPHLDWLTPATEIELYAPGGVPRDLLLGYMMLVRYPALSERTFRYELTHDS